jgi:heat shock protein HslJ
MRCWLCDWQAVLVQVAALTLASCASNGGNGWVELKPEPTGSGPMIHIMGTVHHLDLEGGLFVIRDAEGTQYNPINLPDAFRVEGMAVEVDARRRDDMASIGMVGPLVELLRIRNHPGGHASASTLVGTEWRLEDLAGAGVMDRVQATLEFPEEGRVSGNGSCNQFHATVTVNGGVITFGPLATTRKMCGEAVMHQENEYLAALREVERFEIREPFLYIFAANRPQPLRFISAGEWTRFAYAAAKATSAALNRSDSTSPFARARPVACGLGRSLVGLRDAHAATFRFCLFPNIINNQATKRKTTTIPREYAATPR